MIDKQMWAYWTRLPLLKPAAVLTLSSVFSRKRMEVGGSPALLKAGQDIFLQLILVLGREGPALRMGS